MRTEKEQQEYDLFWAAIKSSADSIRHLPAWVRAGVSIEEDGYTTLWTKKTLNSKP